MKIDKELDDRGGVANSMSNATDNSHKNQPPQSIISPPPQGIAILSTILSAHKLPHHTVNRHYDHSTSSSSISIGVVNKEEREDVPLDRPKVASNGTLSDKLSEEHRPTPRTSDPDGRETPKSASTVTTAFSVEEFKEMARQMEAAAEFEREMKQKRAEFSAAQSNRMLEKSPSAGEVMDKKRSSSVDFTPPARRGPGRPRKHPIPVERNPRSASIDNSIVSPSAKWPAVVVGDPVKELHRACQYGQTVSVEAMLRKGTVRITDTDSNTNTALHEAAVYGQLAVVKLLLKLGASLEPLNSMSETPLQLSRSPIVTLLLKELITRNAVTKPPLHSAVLSGDNGKVRETASTENVNETDDLGFTALHWAAFKNRPDMIAILSVPPNINLSVQSKECKFTPLHEASRFNSPEALQKLLDLGADPLLPDHNGLQPLDHAPNKIIRRIFRKYARRQNIPELLRSPKLSRLLIGDTTEDAELDDDVLVNEPMGFSREERKLQQVLSILGRSSPPKSSSDGSAGRKRGRPPKTSKSSSSMSSISSSLSSIQSSIEINRSEQLAGGNLEQGMSKSPKSDPMRSVQEKRRPGRPRKEPPPTELLLVNLDGGWHFLSCQLELRLSTFHHKHSSDYGRPLSVTERERISSCNDALLQKILSEQRKEVYLVAKEVVYAAAKSSPALLDRATVRYLEVSRPRSLPLKFQMKQQWKQ